jgi:hypothetical protein
MDLVTICLACLSVPDQRHSIQRQASVDPKEKKNLKTVPAICKKIFLLILLHGHLTDAESQP